MRNPYELDQAAIEAALPKPLNNPLTPVLEPLLVVDCGHGYLTAILNGILNAYNMQIQCDIRSKRYLPSCWHGVSSAETSHITCTSLKLNNQPPHSCNQDLFVITEAS